MNKELLRLSPLRVTLVVVVATVLCAGSLWYSFIGGYWSGFVAGAIIGEGPNIANWLAPLLGLVFGGLYAGAFAFLSGFVLYKNRLKVRMLILQVVQVPKEPPPSC